VQLYCTTLHSVQPASSHAPAGQPLSRHRTQPPVCPQSTACQVVHWADKPDDDAVGGIYEFMAEGFRQVGLFDRKEIGAGLGRWQRPLLVLDAGSWPACRCVLLCLGQLPSPLSPCPTYVSPRSALPPQVWHPAAKVEELPTLPCVPLQLLLDK